MSDELDLGPGVPGAAFSPEVIPERNSFSFYRPHERQFAPHDSEEITKQSHKAECDIHTILSQFQRTGILTHINQNQAEFMDLPDGVDFQSAMELVKSAEHSFAALPSKVRDRFDNDPFQFLAAFQDPAMEAELRDLGLLNPIRPPDPLSEPEAPSS